MFEKMSEEDVKLEKALDIAYCLSECDRIHCIRHGSKMPDMYGVTYGYFKGNERMCPFKDEEAAPGDDKFIKTMESIATDGIKNIPYQDTLKELEKYSRLSDEVIEDKK